jgi:hypothetical protein
VGGGGRGGCGCGGDGGRFNSRREMSRCAMYREREARFVFRAPRHQSSVHHDYIETPLPDVQFASGAPIPSGLSVPTARYPYII